MKIIKKQINGYDVLLTPCKEGGFTVTAPSLPGCISEGDTLEESIFNIKEAMDLYLSDEKAKTIEPFKLASKSFTTSM